MNKTLLVFLVLFYSTFAVMPSCHAAINLAKGKLYTVSPPQNYALSAPPDDTKALTDGKYTVGFFWTQKTTVGWHPVKSVEILIDLEKVSIVDGISFSTARGQHSGVMYPINIAAFVGPDKEHFQYVGDIADTPENKPGDYQTKRFQLDSIKTKGRYVLLEIIASKSNSVFCDEIEVIEGNQDNGRTGNLTLESVRTLTEQTRRLDTKKKILNWLTDKFAHAIAAQPSMVERLVRIRSGLHTLKSMKDAEVLETDLLKLRGEMLTAQFPGEKLLIEAVSPWVSLTPVSSPSSIPLQHLSLSLPQGGYGYAAFIVTNLLPVPQQITLLQLKMSQGAPELLLYQVPFIQSAAMEYVADPLVPLKAPVDLRSGESKMFFLTAVVKNPGAWQSTLSITSDKSFSRNIPVEMFVSRMALPKEQILNAVNWGYLDSNPIKNCKILAASDLSDHHTNVLVVPPAYLQGANQVKPVDLSKLGAYIKQHKGISKILLGIGLGDANHKTVVGEYPFLSKDWQVNFRKWYEDAEKIVVAAGFQPNQLYIYPYDEMGGVQIDDFVRLSTWAKKEIPGIQFYATLVNKNSYRSLPYLDIAQFVNNDVLLDGLPSTATDIWLYSCKGFTKSLSPYAYYRLMAWKAFAGGYKGIGFWAYADSGKSGTTWDDIDGNYPDYAVIYEGPDNTIISSRRWEAWRMGIEDYELLTMYAKAKGNGVAKVLAKSVLDNPQDTSKADEIRKKILLELE